MNIKILVLSNGDKVIGKIVDNNDNLNEKVLLIEKPFILREMMTKEGFSIVPIPFIQSSDEKVQINISNITVFPCNPLKEFVDMYIEITTNIIMPKIAGLN